jgi:dTDP-4-dehydrorhamnose 3,5-epimerase
LVLTDEVHFLYKTTEYYYPEYDSGIIWNDPEIGIKWPFKEYGIEKPILSEKDKKLPTLRKYLERGKKL